MVILAAVGLFAFGTGAGTTWMVLRPAGAQSAAGVGAKPAPDLTQKDARQKFFGGDPDRSVRGGQELKPRW